MNRCAPLPHHSRVASVFLRTNPYFTYSLKTISHFGRSARSHIQHYSFLYLYVGFGYGNRFWFLYDKDPAARDLVFRKAAGYGMGRSFYNGSRTHGVSPSFPVCCCCASAESSRTHSLSAGAAGHSLNISQRIVAIIRV